MTNGNTLLLDATGPHLTGRFTTRGGRDVEIRHGDFIKVTSEPHSRTEEGGLVIACQEDTKFECVLGRWHNGVVTPVNPGARPFTAAQVWRVVNLFLAV